MSDPGYPGVSRPQAGRSHPVLPPPGFGEPEGRAECVWSGALEGGGVKSKGWGTFLTGGLCMDF